MTNSVPVATSLSFIGVNMAQIKFPCPNCKKTLNAPANLAGKAGACPHCKGKFKVPMPVLEAEATIGAKSADNLATEELSSEKRAEVPASLIGLVLLVVAAIGRFWIGGQGGLDLLTNNKPGQDDFLWLVGAAVLVLIPVGGLLSVVGAFSKDNSWRVVGWLGAALFLFHFVPPMAGFQPSFCNTALALGTVLAVLGTIVAPL